MSSIISNHFNWITAPKGTGKSKILEAISKHYKDSGTIVDEYKSKDNLDEVFDKKGKELDIDFSNYVL